jgi:hypothetical protein
MSIKHIMLTLFACLFAATAAPSPCAWAAPTNTVKAGELVIDPPTLINLGFEWVIKGDDNRNARVDVAYRKKGDAMWKTAMPLLRLQHERVYQGEGVFNVEMPNMFAGSIFDLEENTAYDVRLTLSDPDGGSAVRTVTVKTRAEPMPATGGHVYHVYPRDWKGPKEPGAFNDLMTPSWCMPAPIAITPNSTPATAASIPPHRWKALTICSARARPKSPS